MNLDKYLTTNASHCFHVTDCSYCREFSFVFRGQTWRHP